MAGGQGAVGEVRVMPDRLHAFTMAICRADGSSDQEARLVADHLVLANLFGHDSHGVGMLPTYVRLLHEKLLVPNQTAEIVVDRKGRTIYLSNRGHDSLAVFAIDGTSGKLTPVEIVPSGGKIPP